jgi:hypothetical protein
VKSITRLLFISGLVSTQVGLAPPGSKQSKLLSACQVGDLAHMKQTIFGPVYQHMRLLTQKGVSKRGKQLRRKR